MTSYRICERCIMDTSDPDIIFEADGTCNHCNLALFRLKRINDVTAEQRSEALKKLVEEIKTCNRDKKYDCVIGISGGVDSTYLAYRIHGMGLRPLAIHVDNGWNSELSLTNMKSLAEKIGIDFKIITPNWDEFKDLQLAFLRASVPDIEVPTDHALNAILRWTTAEHGLKYLLMGTNTGTESILPDAWSQGGLDWRYIQSIHQQFGKRKITSITHASAFDFIDFEFIHQVKDINILDYMDYSKNEAMNVLQNDLGWQYYGGKHYESIYTRFVQGYILPVKFNFDKRRAHLSSLIAAGEMTRGQALEEIKICDYPEELMKSDRELVLEKLELTIDEFEDIMRQPPQKFDNFKSNKHMTKVNRILLRFYKSYKKRLARLLKCRK